MKFTACLACVTAAAFIAPATAKPAYVISTVNLRSSPGTTNEIVGKVPAGSLVDATNCTDGWCAVSWEGKNGFTIQTALDLSGRVPVRPQGYGGAPPPGYGPDSDVVVEGPPVYYGPPAPYYYGYYGPRYYPYWGWRHHW